MIVDVARTALIVAVILVLAAWVGAPLAAGDTSGAGNAFYQVFVEDEPGGEGIGTFTVVTGPSHPAGGGRDILFGGSAGDAWSSYMTVRSYATGTDYVQGLGEPSSGNIVVSMDSHAAVEAISTSGYRTTYDLPGVGEIPDAFQIISDVNVNGLTFTDSAVEITTTVTNLNPWPTSIGVRYLIDFQVAGDDGPTLEEVDPDQPPRTTETTYAPPAFAAVRITDNSDDEPTLTISAAASADYPDINPATSPPDILQYAYWPDAHAAAFDYQTSGRDIADPSGLDDSAILYYFGATEAAAIDVEPQQSVTISLSLFAGPVSAPTPTPTPTPASTPTPTLTSAPRPTAASPTPAAVLGAAATPVPGAAALPQGGAGYPGGFGTVGSLILIVIAGVLCSAAVGLISWHRWRAGRR